MSVLALHGGPMNGQVIAGDVFGAELVIPEVMSGPPGSLADLFGQPWAFVEHRYSCFDGEYLGIRLKEPYSWWTVEPFPRWAAFVRKVRRLGTLRLRFVEDKR